MRPPATLAQYRGWLERLTRLRDDARQLSAEIVRQWGQNSRTGRATNRVEAALTNLRTCLNVELGEDCPAAARALFARLDELERQMFTERLTHVAPSAGGTGGTT